MMIPGEGPGAAWTAAVAGEREMEGRRSEAAKLVRHAWGTGDLPAREGGARRIAHFVTQQNPERAALAGCGAKSPRRGQVSLAGKLCHDRRERGAFERL